MSIYSPTVAATQTAPRVFPVALVTVALAASLVLGVDVAAEDTTSVVSYPAPSGEKDASPMFRRMDTNGDGKVTREESLGLWTEAFRNQDKDGNRMLDVAEFGHPASFNNADADQNGKATLAEFTKM